MSLTLHTSLHQNSVKLRKSALFLFVFFLRIIFGFGGAHVWFCFKSFCFDVVQWLIGFVCVIEKQEKNPVLFCQDETYKIQKEVSKWVYLCLFIVYRLFISFFECLPHQTTSLSHKVRKIKIFYFITWKIFKDLSGIISRFQ